MSEKFRILKTEDISDMKSVIEDDGMVFDAENLRAFFNRPWNYAFGCFVGDKIIGLAYAYDLQRPDGRHMFYLHSIGLLTGYRDKGLGTKFFQHIADYARNNGFSEIFVITDRGNPRACRIYEKAGAKNDYENEIVYVMNFKRQS
jgi:GNAT superfamily N-acetyltransferase